MHTNTINWCINYDRAFKTKEKNQIFWPRSPVHGPRRVGEHPSALCRALGVAELAEGGVRRRRSTVFGLKISIFIYVVDLRTMQRLSKEKVSSNKQVSMSNNTHKVINVKLNQEKINNL